MRCILIAILGRLAASAYRLATRHPNRKLIFAKLFYFVSALVAIYPACPDKEIPYEEKPPEQRYSLV